MTPVLLGSAPPMQRRDRPETKERDPRLPCTGAGAPSPLRFGAVGHGSGSDRPLRRLIGAPTAPPLPCCAVTDRGFRARAARGLARSVTQDWCRATRTERERERQAQRRPT